MAGITHSGGPDARWRNCNRRVSGPLVHLSDVEKHGIAHRLYRGHWSGRRRLAILAFGGHAGLLRLYRIQLVAWRQPWAVHPPAPETTASYERFLVSVTPSTRQPSCCSRHVSYSSGGASPASQSDEPVLDSHGWRSLIFVGGGIIGFVALVSIISMYGAIAVFLFYYTWFLGRHGLVLSLSMSLIAPVALFFFFEGAMRITMPSGMSFTDPVFNFLYDIIY